MNVKNKKSSSLRNRFKLLLICAVLPLFILTNLFSINSYLTTRKQRLEYIEYTTRSLHNVYDSLLRSSISTYLRAKIETSTDITYKLLASQKMDLEQKKYHIINSLMNIKIGETGYFYGIDSTGFVVFHPDPSINGTSLAHEDLVIKQLKMKEGYLEYEWMNSYELEPRKKALYMTYIPELDWYITATSYRNEFTDMVALETIQETVESMNVGNSGYSYVVHPDGGFIAHPLYSQEKDNALLLENDYKTIITSMFDNKEGFLTYDWREDESERFRKKIVFSKYIEDFNWVVATAMYEHEISKPLKRQLEINTGIVFLLLIILAGFLTLLGRTIANPLSDIHSTMRAARNGNLTVRTLPGGPTEIHELGENLNSFIEALEIKTSSLESALSEKDQLIHEIQHRINNNLQIINSLISLHRTYVDESETDRVLKDLQTKVSVIGMVYDHMLLKSSDFHNDSLYLASFLEDYTSLFIYSYDIDCSRFNIIQEIPDIKLQRNMAIYCGLLLNEFIAYSNSRSKKSGTPAEFKIIMKYLPEDKLLLCVSDNAGTFREPVMDIEMPHISTTFISVIVRQLNGEIIKNDNNDPDAFCIEFPEEAPPMNI